MPRKLCSHPSSKLIGKTLGELEFRSRYHVSVLAIRRRGEPLTKNLASQRWILATRCWLEATGPTSVSCGMIVRTLWS